MGLREKNKENTRLAILESARRLLVERGYQGTPMEDVAADAGVSVGTLYNYFASKQALLAGVLEEEGKAMVAAGERILAVPSVDSRQGVKSILKIYADDLLGIPKDLLREFISFALSDSSQTSETMGLDRALLGQLERLFAILGGERVLSAKVSQADAAFVVYSILFGVLLTFVSDPGMKVEDAKKRLIGQVDIVFDGLGPTISNKEK